MVNPYAMPKDNYGLQIFLVKNWSEQVTFFILLFTKNFNNLVLSNKSLQCKNPQNYDTLKLVKCWISSYIFILAYVSQSDRNITIQLKVILDSENIYVIAINIQKDWCITEFHVNDDWSVSNFIMVVMINAVYCTSGLEISGSLRVSSFQILGGTPRFWLARSPSDSYE